MINFCTGQSQWWDVAAAIFSECVDLATSIGTVNYKHCKRNANVVAHKLVSYSFCNRTSVSWVDEPPGWLTSSLVNDVTVTDA